LCIVLYKPSPFDSDPHYIRASGIEEDGGRTVKMVHSYEGLWCSTCRNRVMFMYTVTQSINVMSRQSLFNGL
jgi:hypothetical protein